MDNRGKRQAASIFGGMGFYIALLVCVLAAGVVGYFALTDRGPGTQELEPVSQTEPGGAASVAAPQPQPTQPVMDYEPVAVPQPKPEVPVIAEEPEVPVSAPDPEPVVEPVVQKEEAPVIVAPLSGELLAVFSVDELTYDATLGDWRTHDGVDIQAAAGTQVVAATAGTVRSVGWDDTLGATVVIDHPGGVVTTYASLQEAAEVSPGDAVSAGTVIGAVGNTSLSEAALGAHLHFSVAKDGKTMDPEKFLG